MKESEKPLHESIIQRARLGEQRAFQQLLEEYHDIVWRTARVLLPDTPAVEDVLQGAWIDVWRSLARFKEGLPFRPWLLTIVANRCHMTLRRRHIPTIPLESVEEERLISPDNVIAEIVALEQTSEWQAAFAALPVKHQQVLELHFFAELELAEIALVIGIPLGTVRSRLHRAFSSPWRKSNMLG